VSGFASHDYLPGQARLGRPAGHAEPPRLFSQSGRPVHQDVDCRSCLEPITRRIYWVGFTEQKYPLCAECWTAPRLPYLVRL
jgi:hypothetical protein